jgi:hypothetical protein
VCVYVIQRSRHRDKIEQKERRKNPGIKKKKKNTIRPNRSDNGQRITDERLSQCVFAHTKVWSFFDQRDITSYPDSGVDIQKVDKYCK